MKLRHNTFLVHMWLIWFVVLSMLSFSQSTAYAANWGMVGGKLVAVTGSKTISGPDKRSLMQTYNMKTGATTSSVDIYGNKWGIDEKGEFRLLCQVVGAEVINGTEVTKMKDLLTGKISGTDMYENQYRIENGKLRLDK